MQSLIIDIGNSRTKLAIFQDDEILKVVAFEHVNKSTIENILIEFPEIDSCIVSNVGNQTNLTFEIAKQLIPTTIAFNSDLKIPIENLYLTPETLGKDRLAAAVGANYIYPSENILVVDAGTAITYEFINSQNQYLGGYITPGVQTRLNSLNHYTSKLPLLKLELLENKIGDTTNSAILNGLQKSILGEFNEVIAMFHRNLDEIKIILTGGNADYFDKILKNYKFVVLEITLIGLNRLLNYNLDN